MNKSVKTFFLKLLLISSPGILLLGLYLCFDPFKVLYHYNSFYTSGKPNYVTLNRDYISTETFLNNYPAYHYDSYIFGSSRSRFYNADTWGRYVHSKKYFHFDASGESIYGIEKKIEFLTQRKYPISNALIVLDADVLSGIENSKGHLTIKHPLFSGQSAIAFQQEFFLTFCNIDFLKSYIDFKISGRIKPYMQKNEILSNLPLDYDLKSNQVYLNHSEQLIKTNPTQYYTDNQAGFERKDTNEVEGPLTIKEKQKKLLDIIKNDLLLNHTNYRVVLSPQYSQERFNRQDYAYLCNLFGKENVFDFSGKSWMTSAKTNFYDWSHPRAFVQDSIMQAVYGGAY